MMRSNSVLRKNHNKLLASGIWSDILERSYYELAKEYDDGRSDAFKNALDKARTYLRYWPKPYQYVAEDMWFVGALSYNVSAKKNGLPLMGYQCIPSQNLCACRWSHPHKRKLVLATCAEIQTVLLYQKARSYEVRRVD